MAPEGARAVLVMVVDFSDSPVSCSEADVTDKMFTGIQSVDGLYQEASFGQVSFPGDTDADGSPDVLRVSIDATVSGTCDYSDWAAAIIVSDAGKIATVHRIEPARVDLEPLQGRIRRRGIDFVDSRDRREIAHPAEQPRHAFRFAGLFLDLRLHEFAVTAVIEQA